MSAGVTSYGVEARRGEAAARSAIGQAVKTQEPGHIACAILDAVDIGGPYLDGVLNAVSIAAAVPDTTCSYSASARRGGDFKTHQQITPSARSVPRDA
jgi:hypothetical protein